MASNVLNLDGKTYEDLDFTAFQPGDETYNLRRYTFNGCVPVQVYPDVMLFVFKSLGGKSVEGQGVKLLNMIGGMVYTNKDYNTRDMIILENTVSSVYQQLLLIGEKRRQSAGVASTTWFWMKPSEL